MKIASHADKVRRLLQLRGRLDPVDDFELWYWTGLTAGTNMWNASLHALGITSEDRAFSTIPGVHVVPQSDGSYRRELRGPGDVTHVDWPVIPGDMPPSIQHLASALHAMEVHRDPCIRGDRAVTPRIVAECDGALRQATAVYESLLR